MARVAELETQLASLKGELEAKAGMLAEAADQLQKALQVNESLTTKLKEFEEAQALAEQAAAEQKLQARKNALAEVVPAADLEATLTNMSALDDGAFTFMVDQMRAVKEARAKEFQAVGTEGVEVDEKAPELTVMDNIRQAGIAAAKARR